MKSAYFSLIAVLALLTACFERPSSETSERKLAPAHREAASSDCPEARKLQEKLSSGNHEAFDLQGSASTGCSTGSAENSEFSF